MSGSGMMLFWAVAGFSPIVAAPSGPQRCQPYDTKLDQAVSASMPSGQRDLNALRVRARSKPSAAVTPRLSSLCSVIRHQFMSTLLRSGVDHKMQVICGNGVCEASGILLASKGPDAINRAHIGLQHKTLHQRLAKSGIKQITIIFVSTGAGTVFRYYGEI